MLLASQRCGVLLVSADEVSVSAVGALMVSADEALVSAVGLAVSVDEVLVWQAILPLLQQVLQWRRYQWLPFQFRPCLRLCPRCQGHPCGRGKCVHDACIA